MHAAYEERSLDSVLRLPSGTIVTSRASLGWHDPGFGIIISSVNLWGLHLVLWAQIPIIDDISSDCSTLSYWARCLLYPRWIPS